ncbi:response regulator [Cohnella thailandensis]|uniref:Circadian input-output histidine kinase CikA n=1 Tax=Cohnella thailandensis TaxID=557557 RepID=A0A841T240_9BACL|nr:response regulator [Cohnella thailandensis]MBB6636448.1 response regulator [Cohnella thailandensis]MBP1973581.1 two-component system sensor histidine kinase/response regulator [Cohnella thailandensis]
MLQSLRLRTWLLLLVTTLVTSLVCGLVYYQTAQSAIRSKQIDNAAVRAATQADALGLLIRSFLKLTEADAESYAVRYGDDFDRMLFLREERNRMGDVIESLGYSDLSGRLELTNGQTLDLSADPSFYKATLGQTSLVDSPTPENEDGVRITSVFHPVIDYRSQVKGVLWVSFRLDVLFEELTKDSLLRDVKDASYADFSLINAQGEVLNPSEQASPLPLEQRQRIITALRGEDSARLDIPSGMLFAYKIPDTRWSLVQRVSTDELFKPLHALLLRTVAISLITELALSLLLLLLITPPFKRIEAIVKATEEVAAGNLHIPPLPVEVRDEIGALSASVNAMVAQLRNSFDPLKAFTEQNDYGIIVTDTKYVITQFNGTAQRMLGYAAEEVVGKMTPLQLSDQDDIEAKAKRLSGKLGRTIAPTIEFLDAMISGRTSYTDERIYMTKSGRPIPILLSISKITDNSGSVTGYIGLFREISHEKRIQAEMLRAKEQAEEANASKSLFLARMSHEIRTPINGIIGMSQLMKRTSLTEAQLDYMEKIVSSSEVLLEIVNDILDYSKIEAGKFELDKIVFEPDELFRKLGDTLSFFLGTRQLDMIFDVPDSLPRRIVGDPFRLEQVLLNLLNNAIKFTAKGYIHFRVELIELQDRRVLLEFSVKDTGIGISEAQLANLFQPFAQADGSVSRKYGGTGLGLVISDEIITLMGGRLEVESKEGEGSRFSFALSFALAKEDENASPADGAVEEIIEPMRILCIERPGLMQETLRNMLLPYRADVEFADSWKIALEALRGGSGGDRGYDYIFCNMEMPDMYGEETWLRLRRLAGSAAIISMTTPLGHNEWLRMDEEDRPERTLIKPINRRALRDVVESCRLEKEAKKQTGGKQAPVPKRRAAGDPSRILLVEDHVINQQIACELLGEAGYVVEVASDGMSAISMVQERHYDLVLMDIHMPGLDGYEATMRIRSSLNTWRLPVIAMTANVRMEDRQRCLSVGMNDVLTKPIQSDVLFAVVNGWARRARQIDWPDALTRVNGKEQILRHMLRSFSMEYNGFSERLENKLKEQQWDSAARMLHTLKGVSGNLSASAVFLAAEKLEAILQEAAQDKRWEPGFAALKQALEELLEAIEWEQKNRLNYQNIT